MSSILDQLPYPWVDPVAQQLHLTLTRLYPTPQRATSVAERAGVDVSFLDAQQAPVFVWHDILDLAAQSGLTRKLVATARDLLNEQSPLRPFFDDLLTSPLVGRESELAEVVAFPGATAAVPQWLPELRAMEEHCGAASPGLPDTMSQASVFAVQAHELLIECLRQGGDEVQFQRAVQRRLRAPADTQSPTIFGVFILDAHKPGRLPEVLSQLLVVLGMADTVLQAPGTFRFRISATRLDGDTLADLVKAWVVADAPEAGPDPGERRRLFRLLDVSAHEDSYGELLALLSNSEWCSVNPEDAANRLVTALLSDEPVVALKQAVDRCTTPEPAVLARMLTAADREPETVELNREGFLVNEQPSLDHLRDGFFAPSLDLDVIETEFWAWLERDVFPRGTRTSGRVPMFWLVGPSGAGKSILLLQLLARLGTNAGVSVLLRDRQHEPLPTVAKRARRLSHRRLTIVGLDDPLSFTFGSEEPTWAEAFAVLRGTRMTSGRGLVIFVGTATIERLHIFRQRVAGETQLATHTLQPYRTEFVDHLRDWYHRRTDRETPAARDSDAIMLPAQLFFEWWKGEGVHEFASRFRNRISGYRLPELSSFFDRLLAVNRLYVGVPPGALSQLSANVRDAIRILVEDMHLTHNPIGRPGFWLSHPQLANAVYECWFTPGLHEEQRTEHLAAALADAIKVHVEGWGSIPLLTRLLEEGSEGATLGGRLGPTERQAALREAGEIAGAARADLALPVLAAWVDVDHQRPGLLSWRPAEEAVSRLTVARPFDLGLNALIQTLARVQDEAGIIAAWDFLAAHPDYYGWIALATQLLADHPIADSHADTLRSVIADRSDDPEVFALLLHSLDHPSPHPLLVGMARDLLVTNPDRDGYQELATRLYRLGGDNRNAALTWLGRVRKANGVVLNEIMKRPQPVLTAWDAMSRWLEVYPLEPESDAGFAAVTNWRRWSEERIEMVDGSGVQVFPFQRSLGLHLSDRDTHVSDALMSTIRSMLETFSQSNWTWLYLQLTPHQVRQPEMYELALRWLRGRRSSNAWHHAFDHLCSAFTDEPREELAAVGRDQIDLAWSYPLCARLLGWVLRNSPPNHRESDVGRVLAWLNENQGGADEWGYLFPQVVTASQGPIRRTALERGLAWWREHWDVGAPASYVLRALLRGALEADAVEMVKIVVAEATRWLETKHEGWGHVFLDIQPHLSESDALRLALIFLQAEPASDRWAAVLASIIDNLEPAQIKTLAILWFDRGNGIDSTAGFIWAVVVEQDRCPDVLADEKFRAAVLKWLAGRGSYRSWWHIWRTMYAVDPSDTSAVRVALSSEVGLERSYGVANLIKNHVTADPRLADPIWSLLAGSERGHVWTIVWMTMSRTAPSDAGWEMGYDYLSSVPDEHFSAWWHRLWNLADDNRRRRLRPLGRDWLTVHDDPRMEMKLEEDQANRITPSLVFGRRLAPTLAKRNSLAWALRTIPPAAPAVPEPVSSAPARPEIRCPRCGSVIPEGQRPTGKSSSMLVCVSCGCSLDVDPSGEVAVGGVLPRYATTPLSLTVQAETETLQAIIHCSSCRRDLVTLPGVVSRLVAIDHTCFRVHEVPSGLLAAFWPEYLL